MWPADPREQSSTIRQKLTSEIEVLNALNTLKQHIADQANTNATTDDLNANLHMTSCAAM
jgi:hypothetical protein